MIVAYPGQTHLLFTLILTKVGLFRRGQGGVGRLKNRTNDQHIQRSLLYHVLELLQSEYIVVIVVSYEIDLEDSYLFRTV